jgi:hypothetical protein
MIMDEKLKKMMFDLLLKELKLIDSEREFKDKFIEHYRPIFMDELSKNGYKPEIITGETTTIINKKEDKIIDVNEEELKTLKSIFRNIAKLCHPDKTKNQYKNKLYEEAQIAYETNNLLIIYKIAKKLNIEINLNHSNLELLKTIVEDKKNEIKEIEKSFLWLWANTDSDDKKNELINNFIKKHGK